MDHDRAQEKLDEWLDGELADDESAELSRHLDACPQCRAQAALRRRLGEALFVAPAPEDPRATEAFVRRVMSRVEDSRAPSWSAWLGRALTPALGLGLAALLLSIVLPGLGGEPFDGWDEPEASYAALVEVP